MQDLPHAEPADDGVVCDSIRHSRHAGKVHRRTEGCARDLTQSGVFHASRLTRDTELGVPVHTGNEKNLGQYLIDFDDGPSLLFQLGPILR